MGPFFLGHPLDLSNKLYSTYLTKFVSTVINFSKCKERLVLGPF